MNHLATPAGEASAGARTHTWVWAVLASVGTLLSLGLLALLLVPPLMSAAAAEVAEAPVAAAIGGASGESPESEIEVPRDWSMQPVPGGGLMLRSPDRVLTVKLSEVPDGSSLAEASDEGDAADASAVAETSGPTATETLENGAVLTYGDAADGGFVGLLGPAEASSPVLIEASTDGSATFDVYRAEIAALLLGVAPKA